MDKPEFTVPYERLPECMTLRDHFAGLAMQGLCAREDGKGFDFATFPKDPMRVALWAYDVADQMLKARNEIRNP